MKNKERFKLFCAQIKRLRDVYGEDSYPKECILAMWAELGHVEIAKIELTVTKLLARHVNRRYPPGVDKFEAVLATIREDEWKEEKVETAKDWSKSDFNVQDFRKHIEAGMKEAREGKKASKPDKPTFKLG